MKFPPLNKISENKIILDKKYTQSIGDRSHGIWVSIGSYWYDYWYKEQQMANIDGRYLYKVILEKDVYTKIRKRSSTFSTNKIFIESLKKCGQMSTSR